MTPAPPPPPSLETPSPEAPSPRRHRYLVLRLVCYLAVGLALWLGVIWFVQRLVLFPAWSVPITSASPPGPHVEVLWHETADARVEAWFLPGRGVSAENPGPAVLYAHGNGEIIDLWQNQLDSYTRHGISVLLMEYRGYGRSTGKPSQQNILADAVAFRDLLAARPEVDPQRLAYHGRSLGGGVVSVLSLERPPAALILESTFSAVAPLAWSFGVPGWLVRDRFDSLTALKTFEGPVLIVHGEDDEIIPVAHAHALADAAANGRLLIYDPMSHNSGAPDMVAYWQAITTFLGEHGVLIVE